MIKYSQISKINIKEFSTTLKSFVPKNIFFSPDKYEIVYQCLKHINFRNLSQNKASIDMYCLKTVKAIVNFKSFYTNPIDSFLFLVFNFKTLPFEYKIILERETKSDLIKIG